jgi:hypothetical protein
MHRARSAMQEPAAIVCKKHTDVVKHAPWGTGASVPFVQVRQPPAAGSVVGKTGVELVWEPARNGKNCPLATLSAP